MDTLKKCLHDLAEGDVPKAETVFSADGTEGLDSQWSQSHLRHLAMRLRQCDGDLSCPEVVALFAEPDAISAKEIDRLVINRPYDARSCQIRFVGTVTDDSSSSPFSTYIFEQDTPSGAVLFSTNEEDVADIVAALDRATP